jgi:hypothetical protein
MIYEALSYVTGALNEYLRIRFDINEDKVIISNLINQDGTSAVKDENKIIFTLVNVQEERMLISGNSVSPGSKGLFSQGNPSIPLNLFVLISTSFTGALTEEALKFLAVVIGFFQGKNVFTSLNSPGLPLQIGKLIFEMYNLSFQEQNNLWGSMGAKYVPSILYKVRMVTIDEGAIILEIPEIGTIADKEK